MNSQNYSGAANHFSRTLSPPVDRDHSPLNTLLIKWARTILIRSSADDALRAGTKFKLPKFVIFRAICDALEMDDRIMEAIACFRQMENELAGDTSLRGERAQWELGFQRRCAKRLEKLGDAAMDSQNYNAAADHFSTILMLSLDLVNRMDILIKRSKARALMKSWEEALDDVDEVIKLDRATT